MSDPLRREHDRIYFTQQAEENQRRQIEIHAEKENRREAGESDFGMFIADNKISLIVVGVLAVVGGLVMVTVMLSFRSGNRAAVQAVPNQTAPGQSTTPKQASSPTTAPKQASSPLAKPPATAGPAAGVTMANFQRLRDGMSYAEVVRILGSEGELLSESSIGDIKTEMYMWKGGLMANMNAMFQNGRLVSKAQFGLD